MEEKHNLKVALQLMNFLRRKGQICKFRDCWGESLLIQGVT